MRAVVRKNLGLALADMVGRVFIIDGVEQELLGYQFTRGRLLIITDELFVTVKEDDAIQVVNDLKKMRETYEQADKRLQDKLALLEAHCRQIEEELESIKRILELMNKPTDEKPDQ